MLNQNFPPWLSKKISFPSWQLICHSIDDGLQLFLGKLLEGKGWSQVAARKIQHITWKKQLHDDFVSFLTFYQEDTIFLYVVA
jgi:hypothetical protein